MMCARITCRQNSHGRRQLNRWLLASVTTGMIFAAHYVAAEEHPMLCLCCIHSTGSTGSADGYDVETFRLVNRWTNTANGTTGAIGDPVTLTWGIVADGTPITPAFSGESSNPSNLIARLDGIYGSGSGGSDLTLRPWFNIFQDSYNRWAEISGVTMAYEPNDDGTNIRTGLSGSVDVRPDMRVSGHRIDGNSGTLAYNYYPNGGNMVIDTDDNFYNTTSNDSIRLRNVLMHEVGHGLGIAHFESNNSAGLMEPFINTSFYGPQHDDILAVQRYYGDALEKNGGNDTIAKATNLGTIDALTTTLSIGTAAKDNTAVVGASETDYISIDGTSDIDVFAFSLSGAISYDVSILLDPKGPTYNEGPQGGSQTALNTKALNDLKLELLDSLGSVLFVVDEFGVGFGELIETVLEAGDYFARVSVGSGDVDNIQMYRLDVSAVLIPEPNSLLVFALASIVLVRRRRRAD